jgi:hypothetical protein
VGDDILQVPVDVQEQVDHMLDELDHGVGLKKWQAAGSACQKAFAPAC